MDELKISDEFRLFLRNISEPVLDSFAKAEQAIKEVEQTDLELVIPAVNELRYAGRHLLAAISCFYLGKSMDDFNNELRKAKSHIHRSHYDAYQAGAYFAIDRIDKFRDDYKYCVISDVIPDWVNCCKKLQKAREFIAINTHTSFEINFDGMKGHYQNLNDIETILPGAREDLNKKINKDKLETKRFIIRVSLAGMGIIVAVALGILRLLGLL